MFTGIIQEIGKLINCSNDSMTFASSHLGGVLKGDSIAVNGVCLTVKSIDGNSFSAAKISISLQSIWVKCSR